MIECTPRTVPTNLGVWYATRFLPPYSHTGENKAT